MTEYQVGSLGNLISGNADSNSGTKIVYEKVTLNNRASRNSHESQLKPKSKGTSTFREKGRKLKEKIASPFSRKTKPDIAGDDSVKTVAKSWKHIPESDEATVVDGVEALPDTFSRNAARRIHLKKNTKKHVDEPEREARTIFVGNIPYAHAKKKKLIKFFSSYGNVESIRFRCAPLKDPRMSKKVAVIKHEFHPERSSICAFVVFKSESEAIHAKEANGAVYHDHHLRVDMAGNAAKKEFDPKKCVFIGNVAFSAEEEDLWDLFSKCGAIESVRIVRDPVTAVSKGIAFVNFEDADAAELALQLDGETIKKRKLAVRRHKPNSKPSLDKSSDQALRHKGAKPLDEKTKQKQKLKDEVRLQKKEKRKLRREGEKLLGIVKKKKNDDSSEASKMEKADSATLPKAGKKTKFENEIDQGETKTVATLPKAGKKSRFQGQTVEDIKKKKKKINKGELKKKTVAHLLGGGLQKKKKV
ncbi:RNA-binding protein 34 [Frankliniella occidentalis]|uniref:RNA-binding protein 34 n=1 Tax=Frankliniella occidentalis TaxID=133901 RepID=A0A9C6TZI1_FRAOC|nr:RNA-binding protein 34 [Frankliniella occidentalis]XP_052123176.1 RNA-binding protein 34 [Frankliniella occidentalis]XP_052123177.1 RNA-binding protein 34 [Frankliniella occidentalis]